MPCRSTNYSVRRINRPHIKERDARRIAMSALGHKQTFCDAGAMSDLPPIAVIGASFDHLVGASEQ